MTIDRINLSKKGESVKTELETAEVLNKFSSNIVNNLEVSKYSKYESFVDSIEDQNLTAILKKTRALLLFKINSKVEMKSALFPSCLKTADITPVLSKLYERSMFKQISEIFENIFSKKQCEFRKRHSTQQCLLAMLDNNSIISSN